MLNPVFVQVVSTGLLMIERDSVKQQGNYVHIIEAINDIIQYCDYVHLGSFLLQLFDAVIEKM